MVYRSVIAASGPSRVFTRERHVCIESNAGRSGRVPLEDLGVLVVETRQATITSACLDEMARAGVAVVVCGPNHHPSGLYLPLSGHSFHTQRLRHQILAPDALKRQIWSYIVRVKIRGQRQNIGGAAEQKRLERIEKAVRSGDPTNQEAQAARVYWNALFRDVGCGTFRRDVSSGGVNAILNYGYSILRAAIARGIVASGLHPALGVHHSSRSNPYCLADDLLEVFRPFVDRRVFRWVSDNGDEMSPEVRAELVRLLGSIVEYHNERGPMYHVIDQCAASLAVIYDHAVKAGSGTRWDKVARNLVVPNLAPLR